MDDLEKYVEIRKKRSHTFANGFETGYNQFKIGVMLRAAREEAGFTQDDIAKCLNTKKSAISRIENHAEDIRLSTLEKFAKAIGKRLSLKIA
jgi:ribosome-binding protein aMBF1 (putative translation factor)